MAPILGFYFFLFDRGMRCSENFFQHVHYEIQERENQNLKAHLSHCLES